MQKTRELTRKEGTSILLRYAGLGLLVYIFRSELFSDAISHAFNYLSYLFLNMFSDTVLLDGALYINNSYIFLIVRECIAVSAYIFIATVVLSMPMQGQKSLRILSYSTIAFTAANLIRILSLMWVHVMFGPETFEKFHMIFFEVVSGIMVAVIVIFYFRKYGIRKTYPVITDVANILSGMKKKK